VALAQRQRLRGLDDAAGAFGVAFEIHALSPLTLDRAVKTDARPSVMSGHRDGRPSG
jgi:hypothetical protein